MTGRLSCPGASSDLLYYLRAGWPVVTKRELLTHVWRACRTCADKTVDVHFPG